MLKVALFLANGFEETEAIVTADILRRGEVALSLVSIEEGLKVKGSHDIEVMADILFKDAEKEDYDMLVLPGGPGTNALKGHNGLSDMIKKYFKEDRYIAAICAAPTVLGRLGVLEGKKATCYPGLESGLIGAEYTPDEVAVDGKIITANGPGASMAFGFKLTEILVGDSIAEQARLKYFNK